MPLPQPDPSLPSATSPLFSDTDAARGDHLRANNQAVWENLQYLFDFTGRTTDTLTEGEAHLYYTDVRAKAAALAAALTGFVSGSDAAIAATDTILQAFAKTQGQITADKAAISALQAAAGRFTSAAQTITSGGALTIAHGLGAQPFFVSAYLVCTSSEFGYSAGDRIYVNTSGSTIAINGVNNYGVSVSTNGTTNVDVRFSPNASVFVVPHKTTGNTSLLTNGSWEFYIIAQK